jgi:hypothetical protein
MFWKKPEETVFERAVKAYYKCSYKNGTIPTKPSELFSEVGEGYVCLRNGFVHIAKIFFVEKQGKIKTREAKVHDHSRRLLLSKEFSS